MSITVRELITQLLNEDMDDNVSILYNDDNKTNNKDIVYVDGIRSKYGFSFSSTVILSLDGVVRPEEYIDPDEI